MVEGASFRVTCNHPAGADVFLSGLTSSISVAAGIHDTVFTVSNVSRTDNNKQFFCSQVVVEPSPPALLTVYCKFTDIVLQIDYYWYLFYGKLSILEPSFCLKLFPFSVL